MWEVGAIPLTHGIAYAVLGPSHERTTHWWLMHVLCNVVTCVMVWDDLVATFAHPHASATSASYRPSLFGVCLHAYHALLFPMSADDRAHHLLFAAVLGVLTVAYSSRASNAMLFFMSGLPGGLIYSVLVARRVDVRWRRRLNESVLSAAVNVGLRLVGILGCLACFARGVGAEGPPVTVAALQSALCLGNGVYYTHQSVLRARRS